MKTTILIFVLANSLNTFSQTEKHSNSTNQTKYEHLGVLINANLENETKLFYNQPSVISLIGCPDCEIKAYTIFETDPKKIIYLDTTQFKVEKNNDAVLMNDCLFESSFFAKNGAVITLLIGWAPIAPITIEFYQDGIKLPVVREFSMEY